MKLITAAAVATVALAPAIGLAQPQPGPDIGPAYRACQMVSNELQGAWINSRAQTLATQEEVGKLQTQIADLKGQLNKLKTPDTAPAPATPPPGHAP